MDQPLPHGCPVQPVEGPGSDIIMQLHKYSEGFHYRQDDIHYFEVTAWKGRKFTPN